MKRPWAVKERYLSSRTGKFGLWHVAGTYMTQDNAVVAMEKLAAQWAKTGRTAQFYVADRRASESVASDARRES